MIMGIHDRGVKWPAFLFFGMHSSGSESRNPRRSSRVINTEAVVQVATGTGHGLEVPRIPEHVMDDGPVQYDHNTDKVRIWNAKGKECGVDDSDDGGGCGIRMSRLSQLIYDVILLPVIHSYPHSQLKYVCTR
jgi:hypothetical protein